MIISIIIYFGSAVIVSLLGNYFLNNRNVYKQYWGILCVCFLLALIAAFRGETGTDSVNYKIMFNNPNLYFIRNDVEIGFKILMFLCRIITSNYMFLFGVMGFLTSWFILLSIKEHKSIISCKVSLFVFVLLVYFVTFNIMRQGLAIAMSIYAMTLYVKKRKWKAFGILIIAVTFHLSAILCIFLPIIYKISKLKFYKELYSVIIIIALCAVFHREIILDLMNIAEKITGFPFFTSVKYTKYINNTAENNMHALIVTIIRFLPIVLICRMALRHNTSRDHKMYVYYIIMCLGYMISLLGALTGTQAERIGYSFIYLNILLMGAAANTKFKIGKYHFKQGIEKSLIYIITIILFAYIRLYRNYAELVPYGKGGFGG